MFITKYSNNSLLFLCICSMRHEKQLFIMTSPRFSIKLWTMKVKYVFFTLNPGFSQRQETSHKLNTVYTVIQSLPLHVCIGSSTRL